MKIVDSDSKLGRAFWLGVLAAFVFFSLLAFTAPTAPARHFSAVGAGLTGTYVTTLTGDPGNAGVPVPGIQLLPAGAKVPSAAPNDGGATVPYIEYGRDVMSGGTKTVTFKNAFAIPPACFCTDGTAINGCDAPISTISTTQAVFNGTTTDKFSWQCIGDGT